MSYGAPWLGPKLMAPMMGTEILRPLLPRRIYSAFEFSRDLFRDSGNSGVAMVKDFSEWVYLMSTVEREKAGEEEFDLEVVVEILVNYFIVKTPFPVLPWTLLCASCIATGYW
jgi:hypothetical protein